MERFYKMAKSSSKRFPKGAVYYHVEEELDASIRQSIERSKKEGLID